MSYLRSDNTDGLPAIRSSNGLLRDSSLRRSLTRLDDIDNPRHVTFRPGSPKQNSSRNLRSASPVRSRSPGRSMSPGRSRSPARELSPTRDHRTVSELQDQIRVLKDELERKESFISSRASYSNDTAANRSIIENAKGEVAALYVKTEHLTTKLREAELENETNAARIKDFKAVLEQSKENEARQVALNDSLKQRLREVEAIQGTLNMDKSRAEASLTQLHDQRGQLEEKVKELESRLRLYIQERETAEVKAGSWEKRYQESLVTLRSALGVDYNESVDTMKIKIHELVSENTTLKGRLCTAQETLANAELESKASRETINRLVSEVNGEQSASGNIRRECEMLQKDKEVAEIGRMEAQRECEVLRERLDSSQRAWNATKRELEEKMRVYSSLDHELRDQSQKSKSFQSRYEMFVEQLSCMLDITPSEDLVKDRIRQLQGMSKDGFTTVGVLEEKVRSLDDQLKVMYDQKNMAEKRARRCELDVKDLEDRLRNADRELANSGVYRDGLRGDKEKYLRFMERMGEIMKMDRISAEIGFDMNGDALLARAAQLAKLEADALADRNTHIYNLQRKIKTMKEQLESKDLHLDLLRKKIGQLEERAAGKMDVEREKEGEAMKVKRLEKTCDKYSRQLEQARMEITDLKAQLLESTKFQVDNQDLVSHCEKLETRLGQLDKIRQKQAKKISNMKEDIAVTENGGQERMGKAESAIQALSSELATTKHLLTDVGQREKQLVDLRTVVARMLGLDVNTLAVPDYEIISRLEKLIQAHHAHTLTNWSMDHALENMEDGLRSGYTDAKIYLGEPRGQEMLRRQQNEYMRSASPERPSRSPERRSRSPEKRRTRSPSPTKVDTRKY